LVVVVVVAEKLVELVDWVGEEMEQLIQEKMVIQILAAAAVEHETHRAGLEDLES
jgi:hypothetical protein